MELKRYDILGLKVSAIEFNQALDLVIDWAKQRSHRYICFANVHMTIEARNNSNFLQDVNKADLVLPDGKPIALSFDWLYKVKQERIAGMDFMPAIIEKASAENCSIFLLGSTNELLEMIMQKINHQFGAGRIVGSFSPPFRKTSVEENEAMVQLINNSRANLVLVSLGCPKQEKWMAENYQKINAPLLGVGGAFAVYAGVQKRSPKWMRESGLEWFHRLLQEPGRLFKRYFSTNSQFIFHLIVALSKKARV